MMEADPYLIFTQCHRLYIQGVRRAVRDRLEAAYGDKWWDEGIVPALLPEQSQNLKNEIDRKSDIPPESFLDANHFARIVGYNSKAFLGVFIDSATTFKRLRNLAMIRNEWAHVQVMQPPRMIQSTSVMKGILASLGCREALEIESMSKDFTSYTNEIIEDQNHLDSLDDLEDVDNDIGSVQNVQTPWELWHQFQSCLVLEKSVDISEDDPKGNALVTLRIRNTAPDSGDWPGVHFSRVTLRSVGARTIKRSSRYGYEDQEYREFSNLEPGASFDAEFSFSPKALAAVEFELYGEIDTDQLFKFQRKTGLPGEVVSSILDEFVKRFELLDIKDTLLNFVNVLRDVNETMTIAELSELRSKLQEIKPFIKNILTTLGKLLREFYFNKDSRLGIQCGDIANLLRQFDSKIVDLDEAIGRTDVALIEKSVQEIEEIQLAIIRIEDTIRSMSRSMSD